MDDIQKQYLRECSEIALFAFIYGLGGFIFYARHDAADGRIEWTDELEKAVKDAQEQSTFAVSQTARFGVDEPLGETGGATEGYWDWYKKTKLRWEMLDEADQRALTKDYAGLRTAHRGA